MSTENVNIKAIQTISEGAFRLEQNVRGDVIMPHLVCQHCCALSQKRLLMNHYHFAFNLKRLSGVGEDFAERNVVLNGKVI